jgi:hypothetical protein
MTGPRPAVIRPDQAIPAPSIAESRRYGFSSEVARYLRQMSALGARDLAGQLQMVQLLGGDNQATDSH